MHEPVLVNEVIEFLHISSHERYIDATVGAGGHSIEIVKRNGKLLGLDTDTTMLEIAQKRLEEACPPSDSVGWRFKLIHSNFRHIKKVATENQFIPVSGILFDLGVSNFHFLSDTRGFSFKFPEALLDMRLDESTQALKASDLLNTLRPDQLTEIFQQTMDYSSSRKTTNLVISRREIKPFVTVGDFLQIASTGKVGKVHPATKAFLALRMAVNSEMENIEEGILGAVDLLDTKGRVCVITFHSLEDRKVKQVFEKLSSEKNLQIVTKKPIEPSEIEISRNPKARSAKLRVIEKI